MEFNFVDLLVLGLFIYFIWQGYHTGLIAGLLNTISTVIAFSAALWLYPRFGAFLRANFGWGENLSLVAAFFGILVMVEILLTFALNRVYSLLAPVLKKIPHLYIWDRALGVFPSSFVGLFLISLFLVLPLILPIREGIREPIAKSWWGRNVLVDFLKYQPRIEQVLSRVPYKNLAFLITPKPLSDETVSLDFPKEIKLVPDPENERLMFDLVNKERSARGIKTLVWREDVLPVARAHCLDMFSRGYFSHYSPEGVPPFQQGGAPGRMDKAGVEYLSAGENLAYAPNVDVAHDGLMNSPGHRENILRKEFGRLGVGVIDGGINGKMFCQLFTD